MLLLPLPTGGHRLWQAVCGMSLWTCWEPLAPGRILAPAPPWPFRAQDSSFGAGMGLSGLRGNLDYFIINSDKIYFIL